MTRDQVPERLKSPESFLPRFWRSTGWGYGVAVQTEGEHAGRYGWSGGLGTDFCVDPHAGFAVLLSQVEMSPAVMDLITDVHGLLPGAEGRRADSGRAERVP